MHVHHNHIQISTLQRITSDASTILSLYLSLYLSVRILNLPLHLCTIFASNRVPSISRRHQPEYRSSSYSCFSSFSLSVTIIPLFLLLISKGSLLVWAPVIFIMTLFILRLKTESLFKSTLTLRKIELLLHQYN